MNFLKKLLGGSNESEIKRLQKQVGEVNSFEPAMRSLTDAQLRAKTDEFKERYAKGETLDELLPEAFAVVKEAFVRVLGKSIFDVQVLGGIVLHQGRIAEMKTGEGKTFTAAMPAYLNALAGKGVHIVTVNDYLVKYQGEWMGKVFRFLGMNVGFIMHEEDDMKPKHKAGYAADITYCTNNELGFDYLRDNMEKSSANLLQRDLFYAIVDEADSILIDEARTPLIISGQGDKSTDLYMKANSLVARFRETDDYEKDEKMHSVVLTENGTRKAENFFNIENLTDIENQTIHHHTLAALKAHALMKRDVDYVVQNDQVVIVDEFTGRLMVGRRYSDGLHQAIEAKEGVKVERESKTYATITFQNYFRMYSKLAGMTGTAKTEEDEFRGIYSLDVVQIPTNRPMIRIDHNDAIYRSESGKFAAVIEEVIKRHQTGQPVLVGTVSVEKSEVLSHMLRMRGIEHEVLNAKYHQKEAEIVAQAGHIGAVTIATNMAGRGTDILLGGNPEFMARQKMRQDGYDDDLITLAIGFDENVADEVLEARKVFLSLLKQFEKETDAAHDKVVATGGLHIIGTERHEARRIDNQLRGRAGRQGDPGSSRFYVSLEDDLMRLFGTDRVSAIVEKLGMEENHELDSKMLSKQIENAQKRVEGRNFDTRKHVLEYDDVMNKQREVIYAQRRSILMGEDVRDNVIDMIRELVTNAVEQYAADKDHPELWDLSGLTTYLESHCLKKDSLKYTADEKDVLTREKLTEDILKIAFEWYKEREAEFAAVGINIRNLERHVILSIVDEKWMDHIDNMDQLRDGIGLRAYGHKNPVVEYRFEGFAMFEEMIRSIQEGVTAILFHTNIERAEKSPAPAAAKPPAQMIASHGHINTGGPRKPVKAEEKIGRNSPCPCGSGKKYKNCCGKTEG